MFLNFAVLRKAHLSSVCNLPRSMCWSWFCTEGTSWIQAEGTRTASRLTLTRLVRPLTQSCVFTTLLRWDASPSAWYPALPSVPRPSPWCRSKSTHIHIFVQAAHCGYWLMVVFCLLAVIAVCLWWERSRCSSWSFPPLPVLFLQILQLSWTDSDLVNFCVLWQVESLQLWWGLLVQQPGPHPAGSSTPPGYLCSTVPGGCSHRHRQSQPGVRRLHKISRWSSFLRPGLSFYNELFQMSRMTYPCMFPPPFKKLFKQK